MLGLDILFTVLGFPIGVAANLQYDKLKHFAEKINEIPLKSLFIKAFYKSLNHHGKPYGKVVKNLKKAIKDWGSLFRLIFNLEAETFNGFISKLKSGKFQETFALEFSIQAFLIFTKIGSPNANKARNDIDGCRENLPEEQFGAILKKFELKQI